VTVPALAVRAPALLSALAVQAVRASALVAVALAMLIVVATPGCGAPAAPAPPPAAPPAPQSFPEDARPLARYHSKRLALTVPLPDGHTWRIDDHSRPELLLRHEPTRSTLVVAVIRADELVGRDQCEKLALERHLVPRVETQQTVEEQVSITQGTYDTRVRVTLAPGTTADKPIAGHVTAFGGFLRKCFVFDFATEVDRAKDADVLSSRLAFARARILGGLALDPFAAVARDTPGSERAEPP
jgi:hypothetical protein